MSRRFAAFDIDGTIARTSLFLLIVDELIARGKLPPTARAELDQKYTTYRNREHVNAYKEYSMHSVKILFDNITTLSVNDYRNAVDAVIERVMTHVYVYTRNLIADLKSQGYFLIALSGSEMYAVQQFMKQFDFDVAIGEEYKEENGSFTGETTQVFHAKDKFLKELIPEHNLTTEGSIAIGDSTGDISMLEYVERAIAFNPEDSLLNVAKEKGWEIVVERKNVIYRLEKQNGTYILAETN